MNRIAGEAVPEQAMTLHSRIAELRQDNEQPKILSLTFGERYWQERATALADDCEKLLELLIEVNNRSIVPLDLQERVRLAVLGEKA